MKITKNDDQLLQRAINHWRERQLIDEPTADQLRQSYEVSEKDSALDWKNLSLVAFFFAVTCIALATILLLLDDWLMSVLNSILDASDLLKFLFFALLSGGLYYWAYWRKRRYPAQLYSNEALFMFGAVSVAFALTYLSFVLGMAQGYFPVLILLAAGIYGAVALVVRSRLTWFLCLSALAVWFGTETAYRADWSAYFLGMNYPLRYVLFGVLLVALSFLIKRFPRTQSFWLLTFVTGLVGLFFSLWLLSIFGNYGSYETWSNASQLSFIYWALILAASSVGAIYYGFRFQNRIASEIGIAFLLINFYTRYFEYCWESLHKVIFFALLAASFWFIGKQAERVWHKLDQV